MDKQYAYSFGDVTAAIQGPSGSVSLSEKGIANEGLSVEPAERVSTTYGADGSWMHSLHKAKGGKIRIRCMKNGKINGLLSKMYAGDQASSANTGQNIISVRNPVVGDSWTAIGCAFTGLPTTVYNTEGPALEWVFNVGMVDGVLGSGTPEIS